VSARPSAAHRADTIVEIKATFDSLHPRELWHEKWPALADHLGWLIAEVDRSHAEIGHLRDRLAWYEEENSVCRVCGEPVSKMSSQWWHDETTKDHEAQPSAPTAELGR
jgi:hypothetical protein